MVELGYAENTSSLGFSTPSSSGAVVPGLTLALAPTTRPVVVVYGGFGWCSQAGSQVAFALFEDTIEVGRAPAASAIANAGVIARGWRRRDPSAATRNYEVKLVAPNGGTAFAFGHAIDPLVLHILQI